MLGGCTPFTSGDGGSSSDSMLDLIRVDEHSPTTPLMFPATYAAQTEAISDQSINFSDERTSESAVSAGLSAAIILDSTISKNTYCAVLPWDFIRPLCGTRGQGLHGEEYDMPIFLARGSRLEISREFRTLSLCYHRVQIVGVARGAVSGSDADVRVLVPPKLSDESSIHVHCSVCLKLANSSLFHTSRQFQVIQRSRL